MIWPAVPSISSRSTFNSSALRRAAAVPLLTYIRGFSPRAVWAVGSSGSGGTGDGEGRFTSDTSGGGDSSIAPAAGDAFRPRDGSSATTDSSWSGDGNVDDGTGVASPIPPSARPVVSTPLAWVSPATSTFCRSSRVVRTGTSTSSWATRPGASGICRAAISSLTSAPCRAACLLPRTVPSATRADRGRPQPPPARPTEQPR